MARKRKRSCKYGKLKSPRGRKRCKKPAGARRSYHRKNPRRVAAGRKAARTRKRRSGKHTRVRLDPFSGKYYAFEGKKRRRRSAKRRRHTAHAAEAPRRRKRRSYKRKRPGHHKHTVRGYYRRAKRGSSRRVYVRGHRSHEAHRRHRRSHGRRHGAMANPISLMDGVLGGVCGLVGFGAAEVVDRLLATHALKDTGAKDSSGNEIYVDPGDAAGHTNPTYVIGPMWGTGQWMRLAAGLGLGVVPLAAGGMIKSSSLRSCVQFFGFGALMRTGGKALSDGIAYLTRSNAPFGQRLFMAEISAQTVLNPSSAPAQLAAPAAGGVSVGLMSGCQCTNCKTGIGSCCAGVTLAQVQQGTAQRAAGAPQTSPAPNPGIPSTIANPPLTTQQPPPPATNSDGQPTNPSPGSLRGAPLGAGAGKSGFVQPLYNPNIRRVVGDA